MRILIGLLLAFTATTSLAATLTTTWTNATQRTDGTPFPASALANSTVEWGTCNGNAFGTVIGSANAAGAATSLVSPAVPPAIYCVRVKHNAVDGTVSAYSNVVPKTIIAAPPEAPVIVTVQQTAYEMQPGMWWGVKMVNVGKVEVGVVCGEPLAGNPAYATLTPEQVTLSPNDKYLGGTLYGRCG